MNNENTMHCSISVIIRADRNGYLLFLCADADQPKGRGSEIINSLGPQSCSSWPSVFGISVWKPLPLNLGMVALLTIKMDRKQLRRPEGI